MQRRILESSTAILLSNKMDTSVLLKEVYCKQKMPACVTVWKLAAVDSCGELSQRSNEPAKEVWTGIIHVLKV